MIELQHISRRFQVGDQVVTGLDDVSLQIHPGEYISVMGPSGSGKSSLLMLMGGLETATGGAVNVLGQDLTAMDEDRLARFRRDHMGVVFQSFHLIPTMTALENVATPMELAGVRDAFPRAEAELEAMGLAHRAAHYPTQMSGGEQQRVALARALAPEPPVLLLDEPLSALDPFLRVRMRSELRRIQSELGITFIHVTHNQEEAMTVASRIAVMDEGRIVQVAAPVPRWDDAGLLPDPAPGHAWPADAELRLPTRQPIYELDRAAVAGLGVEGDLLLGWRAGDAIAADLT